MKDLLGETRSLNRWNVCGWGLFGMVGTIHRSNRGGPSLL